MLACTPRLGLQSVSIWLPVIIFLKEHALLLVSLLFFHFFFFFFSWATLIHIGIEQTCFVRDFDRRLPLMKIDGESNMGIYRKSKIAAGFHTKVCIGCT